MYFLKSLSHAPENWSFFGELLFISLIFLISFWVFFFLLRVTTLLRREHDLCMDTECSTSLQSSHHYNHHHYHHHHHHRHHLHTLVFTFTMQKTNSVQSDMSKKGMFTDLYKQSKKQTKTTTTKPWKFENGDFYLRDRKTNPNMLSNLPDDQFESHYYVNRTENLQILAGNEP